jgi:CRP/FNR family nitrogen fixation transcriptional regulator
MKQQISTNRRQSLSGQALMAQTITQKSAAPQPQVGSVQNFTHDREIFAEGASSDYFYKVASGVVRTCKFLVDGRRQIDAFHVPGDIFGLEPGAEHRLSAEAVSDCTVIAYRKSKPDQAAGHDKDLSRELLNFAMMGMVRAQAHSLLLGRHSAVEKVAGFLLDWAEKSSDQAVLSLAMTRQDIADYLGLTIETVSRTLSQLERDNVIDLPSARQIRLRDLEQLEELAA